MLRSALLLISIPLSAPAQSSPGTIQGLVEAELAFAHRARVVGYQKAFVETFSEDAVVFQPRPVPARDFYSKASRDPGDLRWYPSWARISADGGLGLTCGPWQYRPAGGGEPVHGHFVTVWRRGRSGWEVILDAGTPHPAPKELELPALPALPSPVSGRPGSQPPGIQELDELFSREAASKGVSAAYSTWAGELKVLRKGQLPMRTFPLLPVESAGGFGQVWATEASGVSAAGDLGYSRGTRKDSAGKAQAVFVRFWRREGGRWRLDLDLELPLP